jgi:hypothetical protein
LWFLFVLSGFFSHIKPVTVSVTQFEDAPEIAVAELPAAQQLVYVPRSAHTEAQTPLTANRQGYARWWTASFSSLTRGLEAGSQTVARGSLGGGEVQISATQTATVEATAKVSVSATQTGDAGTITIHADEKTTINGTLLAQGGKQSGQGGVINTTSSGQVDVGNTAEVKAAIRGTSATTVANIGQWNVTSSAVQVNTTNAGVISQSLNTNNVHIKVSTAGCAQAGNCNELAVASSAAGLSQGQLAITQDAVIQKTSSVSTSLVMEASGASTYSPQVQNRILVDGQSSVQSSVHSPYKS